MKISIQYFELRHLHTKQNFPQNWFITINFEAFQHHISFQVTERNPTLLAVQQFLRCLLSGPAEKIQYVVMIIFVIWISLSDR